MKDQSKNIDTLLLEELGNITELPPPSVWVSLEARLDEHKRRRTLWWYWPLALVVLLSGTVIGYKNWPAPKTDKPATPGTHQPHNSGDTGIPAVPANGTTDKIPETKKPAETPQQAIPAPDTTTPVNSKQTIRKAGAGPGNTRAASPAPEKIQKAATAKTPETGTEHQNQQQQPVPETKEAPGNQNTIARNKEQSKPAVTNNTLNKDKEDTPEPPEIIEQAPQRKAAPVAAKKSKKKTADVEDPEDEEQEDTDQDSEVVVPAASKPASRIRISDENGKPIIPAPAAPKSKAADPAPQSIAREDYLLQKAADDAESGGESQSTPAAKARRNTQSRFEGGVKLGYETGTASYTARKLTVAAYLQYNISPKLGLVLQPAIKAATTNQSYSRTTGNYYQVTGMQDTLYHIEDSTFSFAYRQTFDSFVARNTAERKYVELDLPIMLRYQLDQHIAISAGFNLSLGKIINLNTDLQTYKGLVLRDTAFTYGAIDSTAPAPASKFSHPGSVPFSSYVPSEANATDAPLRIGYTVGISYTFRERFMVDLVVQKTTSNLNKIPDSEIRKLYSQHYFKLLFGYKLFGPKKKVRDIP